MVFFCFEIYNYVRASGAHYVQRIRSVTFKLNIIFDFFFFRLFVPLCSPPPFFILIADHTRKWCESMLNFRLLNLEWIKSWDAQKIVYIINTFEGVAKKKHVTCYVKGFWRKQRNRSNLLLFRCFLQNLLTDGARLHYFERKFRQFYVLEYYRLLITTHVGILYRPQNTFYWHAEEQFFFNFQNLQPPTSHRCHNCDLWAYDRFHHDWYPVGIHWWKPNPEINMSREPKIPQLPDFCAHAHFVHKLLVFFFQS